MTIQELLNNIKWDEREKPEDYTVGYWDNRRKEIIEFPFTAIKDITDNFILISVNGEEKDIPIHTLAIVRKKGERVWKKPTSKD